MSDHNDHSSTAENQPPKTMSFRRTLMKICRYVKFVLSFLLTHYSRLLTPLLISLVLLFWFFGSLVCFVTLFVVIAGILLDVQDLLLYHPNEPPNSRQYVPSPSLFRLPYENVYIPTSDGYKLNAYFMKQSQQYSQTVPTILFLHGNAGNIGHRLANCQHLYFECGVNVLLLEYRGFGKSNGSISERGLYTDVEAGLAYLSTRTDIDSRKIVLFGRSLGGAVAIRAASTPQCSNLYAVIVENTFTSIKEIARKLFPIGVLDYIPMFCYKNKFPSFKAIRNVKSPILFLSGQDDELVPPQMMQRLFTSCPSEHKHIAQFPGGSHNSTWESSGYFNTIRQFLIYCDTLKRKSCSITLSS